MVSVATKILSHIVITILNISAHMNPCPRIQYAYIDINAVHGPVYGRPMCYIIVVMYVTGHTPLALQ